MVTAAEQQHNADPKRFVDADADARAENISQNLTLYGQRTTHPLSILIIGCGLGGLAAAIALGHAGHHVTILEDAPVIGEVGAGIQVTPNVSRILRRWGIGEKLEKVGVRPEAIALHRYDTGELIGWTRWGKTMEHEYGSPYYHIHRADFHRLLYDLALPLCTIRLSSTVVSLSPSSSSTERPSVTLKSGERIEADLIIGADGVKSMVREVVLGRETKAEATGDAAYRVVIPTEKMMDDPELRKLVECPEMSGWMGPGKHIMAYCIRARKEYNIVLVHPDDGSVESWTAEGSADKMRADFEGWDSRITKLLGMVSTVLKWRLMDRQPIETWLHHKGRIVLLGDSCHPMLPYRAQGAAMAIEDASVLGNLLSHLTHPSQLTPLLRAYESLRHTRTALTQASSRLNQKIFHLEDGEEQRGRDGSMREAMGWERRRWGLPEDGNGKKMGSYELSCLSVKLPPVPPASSTSSTSSTSPSSSEEGALAGNSNQWADRRKNMEQFGYDADREVERWWVEKGERMCRRLEEEAKTREGKVYVARL